MIDAKVIECIAARSGVKVENITPEVSLKDLRLDSLAILELTIKLEGELDIHIDDAEASEWVTVQGVIDSVKQADRVHTERLNLTSHKHLVFSVDQE